MAPKAKKLKETVNNRIGIAFNFSLKRSPKAKRQEMKKQSYKCLKNFKPMKIKKRKKGKKYPTVDEIYNRSEPVRIKIISGKEVVVEFNSKTRKKKSKTKRKQIWKDYQQYLKSRTWTEKRDRVLKKYEYSCFHCLRPTRIVHHLKYRGWGEEKESDLIPVCDDCHKSLHNIKPES